MCGMKMYYMTLTGCTGNVFGMLIIYIEMLTTNGC